MTTTIENFPKKKQLLKTCTHKWSQGSNLNIDFQPYNFCILSN